MAPAAISIQKMRVCFRISSGENIAEEALQNEMSLFRMVFLSNMFGNLHSRIVLLLQVIHLRVCGNIPMSFSPPDRSRNEKHAENSRVSENRNGKSSDQPAPAGYPDVIPL